MPAAIAAAATSRPAPASCGSPSDSPAPEQEGTAELARERGPDIIRKEPIMKIKTKVRAGRDCGGGDIPIGD